MPQETEFQIQLETLRSLIQQAHQVVQTDKLPEGRSERASELLGAALILSDKLLMTKPAAVMGAKGGNKTAALMKAKDPGYFKKIAGMRKTNAGGRPKKNRSLVDLNSLK